MYAVTFYWPLDDKMQNFQLNQCLKFIDFKNAEIQKGKPQ